MSALSPVRAGAVGGLLVLLTACGTGALQVPVPSPPADVARECRALRDRLPQRLHGQARRTTEPASYLVTAWGEPAIAVRCGVPRPAALHPTSQLVVINGVSWLPVPEGRPVTFTTVGRHAYVEATIPERYSPAGDVLIELAGPIKATIPADAGSP